MRPPSHPMRATLAIAALVLGVFALGLPARAEVIRASGVAAPPVERCYDVRFSFAPDEAVPAPSASTSGEVSGNALSSEPANVAPSRPITAPLSPRPPRACVSLDDPGCQARAPAQAP